jgi:tetraacyldisaccharide 4'-kinase
LAGRKVADERIAPLVDGVFYAPFDVTLMVRRVFRRLRPALLVVLETEIWPNLYREAKRFGAALLVVNGRISDKALPSYRRFAWFFHGVLPYADSVLVQSEQDRQRYLELGAPVDRVRVSGNLKFDFRPAAAGPPAAVREFVEACGAQEVWIAASTVAPEVEGDPDEDDVVMEAFRDLAPRHPRLLLLIAPRKPERFAITAAKLEASGLNWARRSALSGPIALPGILLLDSLGELSSLFSLAQVVFMGGTLPHRGGHNILEPALYSVPVISGPHLENFAAIAALFRARGALLEIDAPAGLAPAVDRLLNNLAQARELGARGAAIAQSQRGAVERAVRECVRLHDGAIPLRPAIWPLRALSSLWRAGVALHRASVTPRRLDTPVISIGGLTVGGAGKTPLVRWIAGRLSIRGLRVAILTRGYRRRDSSRAVVLLPGQSTPVDVTGDEAQMLLRDGTAAVGVGSDRYAVAREMETKYRPDVFLLDDGFQHWRLARDLDIVALDALDPAGGGGVIPAGRLREPWRAIDRADIVVAQRADFGREYLALRVGDKPLFRTRIAPAAWFDAATGERFPPAHFASQPCIAFCGLGNPASFWRTLEQLGIRPQRRVAFGDHHRYRPAELEELRGGGVPLLTTEKDAMNLPAGSRSGVYWLAIELECDRESEFLNMLVCAASRSNNQRL